MCVTSSSSMVVFGDLSACANCGSSGGSLRRCTRCRSQAYCGAECQRSHYKRHKVACREAAAAASRCHSDGHERSSGKCQNADGNPQRTVDLGDDVPPHVVPRVTVAATGTGSERKLEHVMCYHDTRPGREWVVESPDPDTGKTERGTVSEVSFRLVPIAVVDVPQISPPRNMVKAGDIEDDKAAGGLSKEETVATLLNAYNIRHYVQKQKQVRGGAFVVMIEYDARMVQVPVSSEEATVCLTVTLRSDGMGHPFPDDRRRFHLHANFTGVDPHGVEAIVAHWVGSATAPDPWSTVRGLLPLGVDFVLSNAYYSGMIALAKERGMQVEIRLYDCSPIFGLREDASTSEMQLTRMMYFMQSAMMEYETMELCRLPDGYTGEEVDANPKAVVDVMRKLEEEGKWVGQPLLVTDEERCVPPTKLNEEAFRVEFDDLEMEWAAC
ncbi:hypothetical protein ACHAWF_002567 [Thalassiosira exigua]